MKKANILPDNVVSTIIAVVILVALGYGVFLWYENTRSTETHAAQTTIDLIKTKIDSLEKNQKNTFTFQGFKSDNNWYVKGWSKNSPDSPDKCAFETCICISPDSDADSCQNNGFFHILNVDQITVQSFFVFEDIPLTHGILPKNYDPYSETVRNDIKLPKQLYQLEIIKKQDSVTISYYSQKYLEIFGQNE